MSRSIEILIAPDGKLTIDAVGFEGADCDQATKFLEVALGLATANDVSQLPPELLRAGRWDQMFFVDLPSVEERQAIWTIQIRKHGRDPADFDPVQLARASDGLTGSEIEAVFVDSLYDAFDRDTEPTDLEIARVLTDFVPLSKTMAEQINALRTWARRPLRRWTCISWRRSRAWAAVVAFSRGTRRTCFWPVCGSSKVSWA